MKKPSQEIGVSRLIDALYDQPPPTPINIGGEDWYTKRIELSTDYVIAGGEWVGCQVVAEADLVSAKSSPPFYIRRAEIIVDGTGELRITAISEEETS